MRLQPSSAPSWNDGSVLGLAVHPFTCLQFLTFCDAGVTTVLLPQLAAAAPLTASVKLQYAYKVLLPAAATFMDHTAKLGAVPSAITLQGFPLDFFNFCCM